MLDYANTKNFGAYLDQTYKIIKQQYQRAFRRAGIDITPEQWIVLSNLYENDGAAQKDLAGYSFKHTATLSRIVDLLGLRGLLERRPDDADKRSYRIFLTDAGRVLVEQAFPVVLELRRVGWKGNNDADYEQLVRILNTVCDNFMSET